MMKPNKADSPNAAMMLRVHSDHHRCGVGDLRRLGRDMKAMASLLVVVTSLGYALAQTYIVNAMRPAEALKVASRLSIGTREEAADNFMATNGLRVGYSLTYSNGTESTHYYLLREENQRIILQFSMSPGSAQTNRLLKIAWISSGTNWETKQRINFTNAPKAVNPPANAP
jgi:hypothetical protein